LDLSKIKAKFWQNLGKSDQIRENWICAKLKYYIFKTFDLLRYGHVDKKQLPKVTC